MKGRPFSVRKEIFNSHAEIGKVEMYHPVLRLHVDELFCFIPAENTMTGFIEFDNEDLAEVYAEKLYFAFLNGNLDAAVLDFERRRFLIKRLHKTKT